MELNVVNLNIEFNKKIYPACITTIKESTPDYGVILTHGAGGDMNTKQLVLFSEHLASAGFLVLRFTCKGLNLIHRTKVYLQVLKYLYESDYGLKKCILAGRSMGSRAAVDVANQLLEDKLNNFVFGVVCISYPLYPPKQRDKLRDKPLKDLKLPVLFISGTEDEMCPRDLLVENVASLEYKDFHWVEGAAHSLEKKGLSLDETVRNASKKFKQWCESFQNDSESVDTECSVKVKNKRKNVDKSHHSEVKKCKSERK